MDSGWALDGCCYFLVGLLLHQLLNILQYIWHSGGCRGGVNNDNSGRWGQGNYKRGGGGRSSTVSATGTIFRTRSHDNLFHDCRAGLLSH